MSTQRATIKVVPHKQYNSCPSGGTQTTTVSVLQVESGEEWGEGGNGGEEIAAN